jgi:hypothetical protein
MKKPINIILFLTALAAAAFLSGGCRGENSHSHDHHSHSHPHTHAAPHGGVLIPLGEEEFQLEFVLLPEDETLGVYVLDGHVENFIRVSHPPLQVTAGEDRAFSLQPVASAATGETVENTSHFKARDPWFATNRSFSGMLKEITIRGKHYTQIPFTIGSNASNSEKPDEK